MPEAPPVKPDPFWEWIGKVLVAVAGVYVLLGIAVCWPMMSRVFAASRIHGEVLKRLGGNGPALLECAGRPYSTEEERYTRAACIAGLTAMGKSAAPLAPEVLRLLLAGMEPGQPYAPHEFTQVLEAAAGIQNSPGDHIVRSDRLGRALAALGPAAWSAAAAEIASASPDAQWRALYVLQLVGPAGLEHAPEAARLLESPNEAVRVQAIRAIGAMGRPAFDLAQCGLVRKISTDDKGGSEALADVLRSVDFGEWQRIIGRCGGIPAETIRRILEANRSSRPAGTRFVGPG